MNIDILGVPTYYGLDKVGTDLAPKAIRHSNLSHELLHLNHTINDLGDILVSYNTTQDIISQVTTINKNTFQKVCSSLRAGNMPLVLGGDHSIAIGSALATQSVHTNIGVLWIDAHTDYNTFKTSQSNNIHGMPLAAITGVGSSDLTSFMPDTTSYIDPQKCVIIANRSVDELELTLLNEKKVNIFTMADIDAIGIKGVMDKALDIVCTNTNGFHLSFDMDAVTPEEAPGVNTPIRGGLTFRESHLITEMIAESPSLLSVEFVELNPLRDIKNQTGTLAVSLIASVFGKRFTVPLPRKNR